MSLDHLQHDQKTLSSMTTQQLQEEEQKKNELYKNVIHNMYNEEKHVNPHDIAGQKGIVERQQIEFEKKKVLFRKQNEQYLRAHPELNTIISVFLFRVLEERPENVLAYAGKFFDQPDLEKVISIQKKHYLENNGIQK